MIKIKIKGGDKIDFNKSNSINNKNQNNINIVFISHLKNKSEDFKYFNYNNLELSKRNLKSKHFKNNSNINELKYKKLKGKNNINKSNNIIKTKYKSININLKNAKLLKKYGSVPSLIERIKKKYFLDVNFFNKNLKNNKYKINISYKQNSFKKDNNMNYKNDLNNLDTSLIKNNKYMKRIIKRKINNDNLNDKELNKNINKENEDSKNCDISSNDNSKSEKDFDIKQSLIKSNILYIKNKMGKMGKMGNGIPFKNKKYLTCRIGLNQKENGKNIKLDNNKDESIIKSHQDILNDSLDSHNTIYDQDYNINDYELFDNNINKKIKTNDKIYRKIITRKRNKITESINNKLSSSNSNKSNKSYSLNNKSNKSDKTFLSSENILNSQVVYRKVNSKRISSLVNNNYTSLSSLFTTQNLTNKNKDNPNVVINKDVTEFLYSEDLLEDKYQYKNMDIKNWLADINLSLYSQNFYENKIYYITELINEMKKAKNKKILYEYIENTFHIHIPGHIYRILLKLEIDSGLLDDKIKNFFIEKDNKNRIIFNKMKPSLLLKQYNNSLNFFNYYSNNSSSFNKNKLKFFLKKYHLIHLYYNFYQNGFDLINFVLLQMYSNNYIIDDKILENCFHIYNKNDRLLVLKSLLNEKNEINPFLNIDKIEQDKINNIKENIYFDSYNNFLNYNIAKNSEINNCNICYIY